MKFLVVLCCFIVAASAFPQQSRPVAEIIALDSEVNPDGSYFYGYEDSDGTKAEQTGSVRQVGPKSEDQGNVASGAFSYIAPDGRRIEVKYTADENGYVPVSADLPSEIAKGFST